MIFFCCYFTLFHMSGKSSGKSGPLWVATKIKKFQNAVPPSRRSPMSRTQRATRGQSMDNWWQKQVIKIFMPRKATWSSVCRLDRWPALERPSPLWTLREPRDPSTPTTPTVVVAEGRGTFFVVLGCDGGLRAWRTTVNAKLISIWRTRGASFSFGKDKTKWLNDRIRFVWREEEKNFLLFTFPSGSNAQAKR